jgi:hypothetical protein
MRRTEEEEEEEEEVKRQKSKTKPKLNSTWPSAVQGPIIANELNTLNLRP